MIKIAKFGGSSLADATQFQKVKDIITADSNRRFVVASAAGKRNKEDNKVTDLLYLCHAHIRYGVNFDSLFDLISQRFLAIRDALELDFPLEDILQELRTQLDRNTSEDFLASRGEYITARLLAAYLQYPFLDAKDIIRFRYNGEIDYERTKVLLEETMKTHSCFVMPGFYGALPDGTIKVMSRGGSDITGSILARLLEADRYENWTDVSGILIADPRIVHHPKRISCVTYSELRELAYMGANVLHEEAISPVKDKNIPICILNTNDPQAEGTMIVASVDDQHDETQQIITGIAGRKDFTVVAIYKNHMSNEVGIIRRALEVFERYRINIEHIPSGIDSFSIVVDSSEIRDVIYDIVAEIRQVCQPDKINVIHDIALIATVGRHMSYRPGISGRLFGVIGNNDINIRMIAQGSDEINIIVGVENKDFEKTVRVIYENFVI